MDVVNDHPVVGNKCPTVVGIESLSVVNLCRIERSRKSVRFVIVTGIRIVSSIVIGDPGIVAGGKNARHFGISFLGSVGDMEPVSVNASDYGLDMVG